MPSIIFLNFFFIGFFVVLTFLSEMTIFVKLKTSKLVLTITWVVWFISIVVVVVVVSVVEMSGIDINVVGMLVIGFTVVDIKELFIFVPFLKGLNIIIKIF